MCHTDDKGKALYYVRGPPVPVPTLSSLHSDRHRLTPITLVVGVVDGSRWESGVPGPSRPCSGGPTLSSYSYSGTRTGPGRKTSLISSFLDPKGRTSVVVSVEAGGETDPFGPTSFPLNWNPSCGVTNLPKTLKYYFYIRSEVEL